VRYYACESLYNIAKVAREGFIVFFSEAFDAMFRLCADPEANVQNAVTFLDNLVKVGQMRGGGGPGGAEG
jgi:vacuole morphology and inheritance protein 14